MQIIDEIKEIVDKWYNERNKIANKMANNSLVQIEYKAKIELKLKNLLNYIKEHFGENV